MITAHGERLDAVHSSNLFCSIVFIYFFKDFIYLFIDTHTHTEREREREAQGEAGSMQGA